MIERPTNHGPKGFGKRGTVTMNRPAAVASPAAAEAGESLNVPKWAIGAVAGLFMLLLVTMSGGIGGGGFLGGLLGGLIANKMMNAGKTSTATAPYSSATPRDAGAASARSVTSAPHSDSVARGGFGTTGSSSHTGGTSFGG